MKSTDARVAVAETESEWLEVARGKTVHQLEALVAGKTPGDKPCSENQPSARRHVLRFDVAPETLALFREAMSKLRRSAGAALDDDSALVLMARHVLGGPTDEGRASYQIALSICPDCGNGSQLAGAELHPVGPEVVAMAACDGQHLGPLGASALAAKANASIEEPGAANECAEARAEGGGASDENTNAGVRPLRPARVALAGAHTGASSVGAGLARRAKQTIPPAMRRAVLHRDHRRCVVPGCRNALFLDLHHVALRSEGGGNEPDNLITLCGVHHRAAHRGEVLVTGRVSTGIRFRHADGSDYGHAARPRAIEAQAKAFAALRGLGFREGESRQALADIVRSSDGAELSIERILREALAKLTATCGRSTA